MNSKYITKVVGLPLTQCLAELVTKSPRDPIEWISHWLYRYIDQELYFYEKSIFLKELYRMQLELEKDKERRQAAINEMNGTVKELRASADADRRAMRQLKAERLKSQRASRPGGTKGDDKKDYYEHVLANNPDLLRDPDYLQHHPSMVKALGLETLLDSLNEMNPDDLARMTASEMDAMLANIPGDFHIPGTATWCLDCNVGLICDHPELGKMMGRPPFVCPETPEWWDRQGYVSHALYDHEIYSCDNSDEYTGWDKKTPHLTSKDFVREGSWLQDGSLRGMQPSLQDMYRMKPE